MPDDQTSTVIGPEATVMVRRALGSHTRATEIAGDASTRRFYRITAGKETAILMVHPEPLDPSSPLYSNQRILAAIGAPIARIIDHDDRAGLILSEDLGDTTLQRYLLGDRRGGAVDPEAGRSLYRQACDLIVLFQTRGMQVAGDDDFARRNALDHQRFLHELNHFHRYFVLGPGRPRPTGSDDELLHSFYDELASSCDALPRVYCHRDFQSRNLMVRDERLHIIDYQDARQGPYTYDAASLLRDSSIDLDERLIEEMLDYLVGRLSEGAEEFRRDFDLMALQRNLKDLGTFGYMATARGRRDYLEYVPRTVQSVRRALLSDRRYHDPYAVLERYVLAPGT